MTQISTAIAGVGAMARAISNGKFMQRGAPVVLQRSSEANSQDVKKELMAQCPDGAKFLTASEASKSASMRAMPTMNIVAVKPDQLRLMELSDFPESFSRSNATYVSVLAGVTINELQEKFVYAEEGIRCMPNTPCHDAQGAIIAMPFGKVGELTQEALQMLQDAGLVVMIDDELQFDPGTAVSGSGPAPAYLLAQTLESQLAQASELPQEMLKPVVINAIRQEMLLEVSNANLLPKDRDHILSYIPENLPEMPVDASFKSAVRDQLQEYASGVLSAAKAEGLSEDVARPLLYATILGSLTRYENNALSPEKLCDEVAGKRKPGQKGGTTWALLDVVHKEKNSQASGTFRMTESLMFEATQASTNRSRELSKKPS